MGRDGEMSSRDGGGEGREADALQTQRVHWVLLLA